MSDRLSIFLRDEVQELLDAFASCFAVKVTFFSTEMEELSVGLRSPGSAYCRLVQSDLKLLYRCRATDREMCRRATSRDRPLHYHCHAGLVEAILPIKLEGKTIGAMVVGQIRDGARPPRDIAAAWTKKHGSAQGLNEAWESLDRFDEARLENMLRLFGVLARFIVSQNYVALREGALVERVLRHVDGRLDERLTLGEAAAELGVSESGIAHALRKKLDLSFTRLVALKRLERFETLVHKDPSLTIAEAASLVGFQDPLYFSRLYKKLRLVPPSTFLASVRETGARRPAEAARTR